jgi:hypothetical protein
MQAEYALSAGIESRLTREVGRHDLTAITRSLETNNKHFQQERERLERGAEDMVAAEKKLADTKARIKLLNRQSRLATTTEEPHVVQLCPRELERQHRCQCIFDVEDKIKA